MAYRTGNYTAFYVSEPFHESSLNAAATKDFVYYNMIRAWKGKDSNFPFNDSHNKNYNVRDGSNWESTLRPRLRERLRSSKNVILILSSKTKSSRALREEMEYGMSTLGLPVIVVYPDYTEKSDIVNDKGVFKPKVKKLWNNLPPFKRNIDKVPTLHIPFRKALIERALTDKDLMVGSKKMNSNFYYKA